MKTFKVNLSIKIIGSNIVSLQLFLIFILGFVLQLVACPLWGQVQQKKELSSSDYHLWSTLNMDNISADEQWVTYKLSYEDNLDSLFVQNVNSKQKYSFGSIESSLFTNDSFFTALDKNGLHILNLKTAKQEYIPDVKQYSYSENSGLLLILQHSQRKKNLLLIRTPSGKKVKEIPEVNKFSLSPNGLDLLYITEANAKHSLAIINLNLFKKEKWIITNAEEHFDGFAWQKQGKSVAFFSKKDDKTVKYLFYYFLKQSRLHNLDSKLLSEFAADSLKIHPAPQLLVSDDLQRIFFNVIKDSHKPSNNKSDVEIWNGNDKWVYLDEVKHGKFESALKNAIWVPESDSCKLLTTNDLPKITLTSDKKFAILSNPKDYEPQSELFSPRDYYLLNLTTFQKTLFIEKLPYERKNINPSPGGNYIAYFKDANWWVYSIKENKHTNITRHIPVKFTAKEEIFKRESVCGNPGWTNADKEILIYDQYDIWAVKPDGSSSRRLTHGRESKIRYRIADIPNKFYYGTIYEDNHVEIYDIGKEIFLRAEGEDCKTGFFVLSARSKEQKIVYRDSYIDQLFYSSTKRKFIFREQKFDLSPQLVTVDRSFNEESFFQSNPQQKKYFWGKAELIRYQNSKGQNLKGAFIYPANYDPAKKYPMIVHIYELMSEELHLYKKPSLFNETGFSETNFSLQGYFVLLPDIIQEYRNVGESIVDCLTSAVENVLEKNIVNPDKIGLIGFSAGGYEVAFTVSQTNLFAASVAGGSNTDLNSLYFSVGQGTGKSEMWRFQSTYWMLEKTPFEAPALYNESSPLFHVQKVKTPLLLWTGKNDKQVDPHQSMEYYLALRKLEKKTILLRYPSESHTLSNPINQLDIGTRLLNWFDYFLKDIPSKWVEDGTK